MSENGSDRTNTGRIIEIKGVVIDAVFPDRLPEIYTALEIEIAGNDAIAHARRGGAAAPRRRPRARRCHGLDGRALAGCRLCRHGRTDLGPRRPATLGRLWNVIGQPIDELEPIPADTERWSIHRDPPEFRDLSEDRDVRDWHQGHRPHRPVRQGRQDRPLRRRRRRQDSPHPGAHPQRRAAARRRLRLRRRRRAHAG